MMEQDFSEQKSEGRSLSHEGRIFIKKMSDGVQKQDDGHYEISLPFKQDEVKLPNNKIIGLSKTSQTQDEAKRRLAVPR